MVLTGHYKIILGTIRVAGLLVVLALWGCQKSATNEKKEKEEIVQPNAPVLDYYGIPDGVSDNRLLSFSDQGAWFSFSIPDSIQQGGFSGPFLMTQDNGIWASKSMVKFRLLKDHKTPIREWKPVVVEEDSPLSKIHFGYENDDFSIFQTLFFPSSRTASVKITIKNNSSEKKSFYPLFSGNLMEESLSFRQGKQFIRVESTKEDAVGFLNLPGEDLDLSETGYQMTANKVVLESGEKYSLVYTLSFLFPEDDLDQEDKIIKNVKANFDRLLQKRIKEKKAIVANLEKQLSQAWQEPEYRQLMLKTVLTLQNNWRSAAGNLYHAGLFPSYHSKWFQGFWAWDSWKHAVALATFNPELAKEQVLAMYDYLDPDGFIPDDIFRNNQYEENNYRDTKPPLSAWAVWKIYTADGDRSFLEEMYPKLIKQHKWWYVNRDHDQNGLCEYGSTDGTLIAAKWESGMDNAVRFDESKLLKNSEKAYSLDQESVDLNSYLLAEKIYLSKIAGVLEKPKEKEAFLKMAQDIKKRIQTEFYDEETGWFYDRNINTGQLIKVKGPEGWLPLWAHAATKEQATKVIKSILDPELFNTKVPFPTLHASHDKFQPKDGYWRGPVWIDQAYFGVKGLQNYGFDEEAEELTYKLLHNAKGVLNSGASIRENYNPVTGDGLESQNFSWSAAHYLLLLLNL